MSDSYRGVSLCHNRDSVSKPVLPFTVWRGDWGPEVALPDDLPFLSHLLNVEQCGRDGLAMRPAPLIPGPIFGRILI